MVTLDRWSIYSLGRCVHTLDQVELDSQQIMRKDHNYKYCHNVEDTNVFVLSIVIQVETLNLR